MRVFWLELRRIQPEAVAELQQAVEDVGQMIPCEMLRSTVQNVRKRENACIEASSGCIELLVELS